MAGLYQRKKEDEKWDDRDGPKWPARERVKWDDRDGPKWPAPARVKGMVG